MSDTHEISSAGFVLLGIGMLVVLLAIFLLLIKRLRTILDRLESQQAQSQKDHAALRDLLREMLGRGK